MSAVEQIRAQFIELLKGSLSLIIAYKFVDAPINCTNQSLRLIDLYNNKTSMSIIGLERGKTALYEHDFAWNKEAERKIGELKSIFGNTAKEIEHVGSTAINTIKAKPIIDIAVAATDFASVLRYNTELEAHGFYYRYATDYADNNISGAIDFNATDIRRLLYACGGYYDGSNKLQTHFIHVVKTDSTEWRNYIKFRDYLNANPQVAKEYENLKIKLCCEYADNRYIYTARKHEFIARIVSKN